MQPAVILVGADKGGVGKTTVSRVLLDYLASHNIQARAFDTESPRGTLQRFHPGVTEIVDVTLTADQVKIIDTLESASAKVSIIDVRAGQMGATLAALRDIGFLDAARDGQFTFVVFHILGASVASLSEIAETAPFVADANYFLVKNFVNETTFFDWDPAIYESYRKKIPHAGDITVPKLNEMAYEQVEIAGVPFSNFIANQAPDGEEGNYSFVLRGYVRTWLRNVSAEFDRVGLIDLLGARPMRR